MSNLLGTRFFAAALGAAILVGVGASLTVSSTPSARAQIGAGQFWVFQPAFGVPVGRAFCNAEHTVEYWAYDTSRYEFSSPDNGPQNRWTIEVQSAAGDLPATFAEFQAQVLALPEFAGKPMLFENHSIVRAGTDVSNQ